MEDMLGEIKQNADGEEKETLLSTEDSGYQGQGWVGRLIQKTDSRRCSEHTWERSDEDTRGVPCAGLGYTRS